MAIVGRLLQILTVLVRHALGYYGGVLAGRAPLLRKWLHAVEIPRPERVKSVFESLGGAFVKLGQMLALQPDILPFEYCHALYSLLDRVTPVSATEIAAVFEQEIGQSPDQFFDSFERTPIASGSIGQVHIATLDGRKLAVKIQRPDTQASFERDVKLMKAAAWLIGAMHLKFLAWMIDPLTEFAAWTDDELDFRSEARYMNQLRRNASDNSRERIPGVLDAYVRRRVLLIEFLDGITLLDHIRWSEQRDVAYQARLEAFGFDADEFARRIIDNFLGDAFRHGMFHADLHPANLMILPGNVVGYIDFGITGVISQFSRQNLVSMTLAYARRDIDTLCERFFELSSLDDQSDCEAFRLGVQRLSAKWYKGDEDNPTLKTSTTMVMLDMLKLSRATRIWPQRDVIKYIRSAIAIDGLVRQFAPGFDVGSHLAVACRRYLSWHARKALCSQDAMINWSQATADLLQSGMFRCLTLLERVGKPQDPRTFSLRRQAQRVARRRTATSLLALSLAAALLAMGTNESLQIGCNLFTAQLMVAGMSLVSMCHVLVN